MSALPPVNGVPIKWNIEVPSFGSSDDSFGGCRGIEGTYTKVKQIGEGTYGQVYLARENATGDMVALKKIRMDSEKEGFPITAIREIKLLSHLSHENVIRLREIVRSQVHMVNQMKGSIYMVCDYMDHDLTGLMERRNYKFTIPQIKCYMKQLLMGLSYCHSCRVLHRDLKASNLLINNRGILKLADFGLARPFKEASQGGKLTNRVITLWYRPPELILGAETYGPEVDIWSCGCILAELILGKPLFPGKDEADQLDKISQVLGSPSEATLPGFSKLEHSGLVMEGKYKKNNLRQFMRSHAGEKVKEMGEKGLALLERMLAMNPAQRISSKDACLEKNGWFHSAPMPCSPSQLPTYEASHEMDMKAKRHAARQQQARGQQQQLQQHGAGRGVSNRHHPHPSGQQPDAKRPRYDNRVGQPGNLQKQPAKPSHMQPPPPLPPPRVLPLPAVPAALPPAAMPAGGAYSQRGYAGEYAAAAGRDYGGGHGYAPGVPAVNARSGSSYGAASGAYGGGAGYRAGPPMRSAPYRAGDGGMYGGYPPQQPQGGYGGGAGAGVPARPVAYDGQAARQGGPPPRQQVAPGVVLGNPPAPVGHNNWERQRR